MSEKVIEKLIDFGPLAVIVILLLYGSHKIINRILDAMRKDYEGVVKRVNRIEDEDRDRNIKVIEKNTEVIGDVRDVMQDVKYAVNNCKLNQGS